MDFTQVDPCRQPGFPYRDSADCGRGHRLRKCDQRLQDCETYAKLGVAAIHLEDQLARKDAVMSGKSSFPEEMVGKLMRPKMRRQNRHRHHRTDRRQGCRRIQAALERCKAFEEAGADVIFLKHQDPSGKCVRQWNRSINPCLPTWPKGEKAFLEEEDLQELGFKIGLTL